MQRIVESRKPFFSHIWGADELTVQSIRPAMIRTLNASRERSLRRRAHARAAMPANIIESSLACDDHALPRHIAQEVVARFFDPLRPPGVDPAPEIEPLHLRAKDFRTGVILPRQRL